MARGAEARGRAAEPLGGPPDDEVDRVVRAALEEDLAAGDLTTAVVVPAARRARGQLLCKADGVAAGLGVFARALRLRDPEVEVELLAADGDRVRRGDVLARVEGPARPILEAERTALNLVQRMSGIATLTARFVERAGRRARVLDTRKTTPGLRALEKHAVRCGGGESHRLGLFDEVMVKDNHLELAGRALADVLRDVRAAYGDGVRVTAEARDRAEALAAVEGGADVVLLDNMAPEEMARLCPVIRAAARARGRAVEIEASGGVDESAVARVAASGVDRVSIGALTHSAPALDLSLELEPLA